MRLAAICKWIAKIDANDPDQSPAVVDTVLAATAIERDLCLVTRNVRDVRHGGARRLDPWAGDPAG